MWKPGSLCKAIQIQLLTISDSDSSQESYSHSPKWHFLLNLFSRFHQDNPYGRIQEYISKKQVDWQIFTLLSYIKVTKSYSVKTLISLINKCISLPLYTPCEHSVDLSEYKSHVTSPYTNTRSETKYHWEQPKDGITLYLDKNFLTFNWNQSDISEMFVVTPSLS